MGVSEKRDLDDRLKQILEFVRALDSTPKRMLPDDPEAMYIAQIKQAFEEAGWSDKRYEDRNFNDEVIKSFQRGELLPGQEWYDRFEKEIQYGDMWDRPVVQTREIGKAAEEIYKRTLEAAKKASGL